MNRRMIEWCLLAVPALALFGCSVHPLPQDVVSYASTVDIVRRIRCEAKEGLQAALDKAAAQGPLRTKHVEKIISLSKIGFEFKFLMSEDTKAGVSALTFTKAASKADDGFTLELVADLNGDQTGDDHSRKNTRVFRVVDDLKDLVKASCGRVRSVGRNLVYPITGSTGMAEVVQTYIELEVMTDLISTETTTVAGKNEMVTFSDALDFTTTLQAGTTTDLKFDSSVGSLKLTRATFGGSVLRQDAHSVTVALARDPDKDPDLAPARRRERLAGEPTRRGRFPIDEIRDKRLQLMVAKRASGARNRVLLELEHRRLVNEDRDVAVRVLGVSVP